MNYQTEVNPKTLLKIGVGMLIVLIIVIIVALSFSFEETQAPVIGGEEEEKKEEPEITLPKVLYNLTGTIKSIGNNAFAFDATIPQLDENKQVFTTVETRSVLISADTKINRLTFVAKEGSKNKNPVETAITFAALKIGDYVEVVSNQDISDKKEIRATRIRILPSN